MKKVYRRITAAALAAVIFSFCVPLPVRACENKNTLRISFFPLMWTQPGKWLVEPVQTTPEDERAARESVLRVVEPVMNRLDIFHRLPGVIITPFIISPYQEPDKEPGYKVGGWYSHKFISVVLSRWVIDQGDEVIRYVFSHELGHWAWGFLTDEEREEYKSIAGELNLDDIKICVIYGIEPDYLIQDWFAEDFRFYACGVEGRGKIFSELGMSRGDKNELKRFFQRFKVNA